MSKLPVIGAIKTDKDVKRALESIREWVNGGAVIPEQDRAATSLISGGSGNYAPADQGVINGNLHDHIGGDGAQIDHDKLANKGNNTHAQIDSYMAMVHPGTGAAAGSNAQVQWNDSGIFGADPNFTWDNVAKSINIAAATLLPDNPLAISGTADAYLQINLQNKSSLGSADIVITADTGNDTMRYADVGIGNSAYASTAWDSVAPYDTYLFGDGGNLVLASLSVGKKIKFFVSNIEHESHTTDKVAEMDNTGMNIPAGMTYKVNGLDIMNNALAFSVAMSMGGF